MRLSQEGKQTLSDVLTDGELASAEANFGEHHVASDCSRGRSDTDAPLRRCFEKKGGGYQCVGHHFLRAHRRLFVASLAHGF